MAQACPNDRLNILEALLLELGKDHCLIPALRKAIAIESKNDYEKFIKSDRPFLRELDDAGVIKSH